MQALLYADPFDVESQKKIEAAIRQVYYFVLIFLIVYLSSFWAYFLFYRRH